MPDRRRTRAGAHVRTVVIIQLLVLLVVTAIWPVSQRVDSTPGETLAILEVVMVLLTVWMIASWRLVGRTMFDPYGMFLIAALLFHAGQVYLEAFGLNENGILDSALALDTTAESVAIVACAVAALHFGALLAVTRARSATGLRPTSAMMPDTSRSCRIVGAGLLLVSMLPAFLEMRQRLATVYESGYAALYQGEFATGFQGAGSILAQFLAPGVLFLLAGSRTRRGVRVAAVAIAAIYILTYLFSGYRGYAAMLALACAWVWHKCVRPLPKTAMLVAAAVTMFVLFPLVAAVRNVSGADRMSLSHLRDAYVSIDHPMVASVSEMGASLVTLAYTLELVPATRPYELGAGYGYALASAFPNLFWDLHPAIARGTPSEWLIWTVDPGTARNGGGLGYSFIAEAYLNFGWVGMPFVMIGLGFLICRFVVWADADGRPVQPARIAAVATFTAFMLSFARGEALFLVRPLLWQGLGPYAAVIILQKLRSGQLTRASRLMMRTS